MRRCDIVGISAMLTCIVTALPELVHTRLAQVNAEDASRRQKKCELLI